MSANQPLIDALEQLRELEERRVAPEEAPQPLTQLYVDFLFAYGFAALGQPMRGSVLLPPSLPPRLADDSIHVFLWTAFALRVEQASRRARPTNPRALVARFAELDRVAAFKVSRLRETSEILEPGEQRVASIGEFGRRAVSALPDLDDVPDDAGHVEQLVAQAAAASNEAARSPLAKALHLLRWVSEDRAAPLLVDAFDVVRRCDSPELYGRAIDAMGWIGWAELVPPALEGLQRTLPPHDVDVALYCAIAGLRRIGLVDEVSRLLPYGDRSFDQALFAGALILVGRSKEGRRRFENFETAWSLDSIRVDMKLGRLRTIANAYALAPVEEAARGIIELKSRWWSEMTDSFGTNSHYCLAVLHFVDILVMAVIRAKVGIGT